MAENELLNFDFQFSGFEGYNNLIKHSKFFEAFKKEDIKQYLFELRIKLFVLKLNSQIIAQKTNEAKKTIQKYMTRG